MDPSHDALVRKLVEMHPGWDLEIEESHGPLRSGYVRQRGGSGLVRYVVGEDDRGRFLEFYSFHRIWGDLHARIRADGTVEDLDVLETAVATTGDPAEDRRLAEAQNRRNRRLLKELDEAGLLSGGPVPASFEINAALASGLLDPDGGDSREG
ncbi:MAG TPA: hypothetical protein VHN37_02120 [Actinomycetota bacterium]|nr:hypothetical protein [Actinomycetota bacterium]